MEETLTRSAEFQKMYNKYFVHAYSQLGEIEYHISKNSKFILDEVGINYSLTPNTENMNNPKIKKYWELPRENYGGNFHELSEENLIKLINDIYDDV